MEGTKKCPYCGKEILAVAKKCKHCGEWLDGREKQPTCSTMPNNGSKDHYKYIYVVLGVIVAIVLVYFLVSNKGQHEDNASMVAAISDSVGIINSASTSEVERVAPQMRSETDDNDKLSETISHITNNGNIVITISNEKVYYFSGLGYDNIFDSDGANCGKIYIYDVNNGTTSYERILIPSGLSYYIESYNFADGKITFVLVDVGRNGYGTGNYITNVSQFNIKTGKWKTIAECCAKAEFTNDRNYVIITTADITNFDEAESASEYEYEYSEKKIKL